MTITTHALGAQYTANSQLAAGLLARRILMLARNLSTTIVCLALLPLANGAIAANRAVCQDVQRALDARQVGKQPDEFVLQTEAREGNDLVYPGIDLDGDGKPDSLLQSCGSPSHGSCTLYVSMTGGGSFEVTDRPFFVTRYQANYYVLVGESLSIPRSAKLGKRRLVLLTKNGPKLICQKI